jgi:ABC-2 type transport system ATP-binding protein
LTLPRTKRVGNIHDLAGFVRETSDQLVIRTEHVNALIGQLLSRGVDMSEVNVRTPTLEDVFLKLTGRSLRD